MDGQVTLRPVSEDDLSWLASLRDGPAATGPHEWHGWSDPQRERRQWAESGLLGKDGGTLIVLHGQLPHYSGPNLSDRSRHAYTLHVIDGECHYPADNWLVRGPGLPLRPL